ncbi:MAG: winged helix-turn-helix transcriptional regulator [Candidatus Taylorbacteria bacterium]|nr:winged helix-turn-helix transcriptional regulator [Candidatus Taylorbacteria bacterium]
MIKTKEMANVFKALANYRRLEILRALKRKKDLTVGEIAGQIKLSFKSTSRHLAVLASARIVDREQISLEVYYEIASELPALARPAVSML